MPSISGVRRPTAISKMHDKLSKPAEPEPEKAPEPTKEELLLAEIRDLLKEQSK